MRSGNGMLAFGAVAMVAAGLAVADLHRVEAGSLTVYTTPALRDLLEKGLMPAWERQGGAPVEPVYMAAGEQYNRLRMSGSRPEADLFLHASPLYIQKGFEEGYFLALDPALGNGVEPAFRGRQSEAGDDAWVAFAWSPLVEVYSPRLGAAPDLAAADLRYGLPHPTLSNNGVYAALFLEEVAPGARDHVRDSTVVQPVNARTNILGVADGSFDVTVGYEAVALFFQDQGAKIAFAPPNIGGRQVSTPVLFSVGVVDGPHPTAARELAAFLMGPDAQQMLDRFSFRSVHNLTAPPEAEAGVTVVTIDWSDWRGIEELLPRYEVRSHG